jgi:predicted permease
MCAVGAILLIACANVASLLFARALVRQREAAVRRALGATTGRMARQFLTESALLAVLGGGLGTILGWFVLDALRRVLPDSLSPLVPEGMDPRTLIFTLALSVFTSLVFGIGPGLHLARVEVAAAFRNEGLLRSRHPQVARKVLVCAQIALSTLLLALASLIVRSLWQLQRVEPGFLSDRLVVFTVDPSRSGYSKERSQAYREELLLRIRALPNVESVALANDPIHSGGSGRSVIWNVEGYESDVEGVMVSVDAVSPGFLRTTGIRLLGGRDFESYDRVGHPWVALANQAFARRFLRGISPIGTRFGFGEKGTAMDHQIVGLVPDGAYRSARSIHDPLIYLCLTQQEQDRVTFHVRTAGAEHALFTAIRAESRAVDANIPLLDLKTARTMIFENLTQDRFLAILSMAFGLLALTLAVTGLYGVLSCLVAARRREIGIRIAIGAPAHAVVGLVMRDTLLLVTAGLAIGLGMFPIVSGMMRGLLFGVASNDWISLAIAACIAVGAAGVATWIPARSVLAVDPATALHAE